MFRWGGGSCSSEAMAEALNVWQRIGTADPQGRRKTAVEGRSGEGVSFQGIDRAAVYAASQGAYRASTAYTVGLETPTTRAISAIGVSSRRSLRMVFSFSTVTRIRVPGFRPPHVLPFALATA